MAQSNRSGLFSAILCIFTICHVAAIAADSEGTTAYVSTADNQWVLWLPMDSKAGIDAAFDAAARDYRVTRVWWRGSQDELMLAHMKFRPANRFFNAMWDVDYTSALTSAEQTAPPWKRPNEITCRSTRCGESLNIFPPPMRAPHSISLSGRR